MLRLISPNIDSPAQRRGFRDFHLRKFENPYPAGVMRQAWNVGFREAAQQYRAAIRAQRGACDPQQAAAQ